MTLGTGMNHLFPLQAGEARDAEVGVRIMGPGCGGRGWG
jgi:hypothetical protein